jgi:hypothetical protein
MSITIEGMSAEQAKKNLRYVAFCIRKFIGDRKTQGEDYSTFENWLDFIEGREYAPGDGETWSDVQQHERGHHKHHAHADHPERFLGQKWREVNVTQLEGEIQTAIGNAQSAVFDIFKKHTRQSDGV